MTWICSLLLVLGLVVTSTNTKTTSNSIDATTSDQSTADKSHNTTTDKNSEHGGPVSVGKTKANTSVTHSRDTAVVESGMSTTVQALPKESSSVASRATTRLNSTTTTTPPATSSPARPITSKSPPTRAVRTTARADTTKDAESMPLSSKTGSIIVIVIVIAVLLLGGVCFLTRKKSRSVDLPSRQDEVQIPLNIGGLEEAADTASQNGISSFPQKDTDVHLESEAEPGNKTKEQEGRKAGADKPDGEGGSEPPAPSPTPASSVDQLVEGGPSEAAPLAPVDQAPVENAPVEQAPMQQKVNEPTESIKTSEESPVEPAKETNENNNSNNNNNFGIGVAGWSLDIPEPLLDSPV